VTGSRSTGLSTTSIFLLEILTTPGVTLCRIGATEALPDSAMVPARHAIGIRKNGSARASALRFPVSIG
jgi:hypothetical protein